MDGRKTADGDDLAEARSRLRGGGFERIAAYFAAEAVTALRAARAMLAGRPDNAPPEAEGRE